MTMLTHPLMIPRYAAAAVPVIPVGSPGQWSVFFWSVSCVNSS